MTRGNFLRRRATRAAAALAAIALAGLALAPDMAAAASIGGFGVQPVQADHNRGYFVFRMRAGGARTGYLEAFNTSEQPLSLRVYSVDGLTGVTSGVVYANHADRVAGAGAWLTPSAPQVSLAPGARQRMGFHLHVPAGTGPGDYLAGFALENANPGTSSGRFQVKEIVRTVVGVEVIVPGPAHAQIHLGAGARKARPGTTASAVTVNLTDTGRLLCKPVLTVSVDGRSGQSTETHALDTVLPDDAIAYPFAWPHNLAPGHYRIRATARGCGPRAVAHGSSALLTGLTRPSPESAVRAIAPPPAGSSGLLLIAAVGAGGLALGAGGALVSRRGRHIRPRT
jgi:hypothetical protein